MLSPTIVPFSTFCHLLSPVFCPFGTCWQCTLCTNALNLVTSFGGGSILFFPLNRASQSDHCLLVLHINLSSLSLGSGEALVAPLGPPWIWITPLPDLLFQWTSSLFGSSLVLFGFPLGVALLICFLCDRVDFGCTEELEDPAFSEAQQLATEGKSWTLIILNPLYKCILL